MSLDKEFPKKLWTRREFLTLLGLSSWRLRQEKNHDYFENYLRYLAENVPEIGGQEKYHVCLSAGIGFATLHNLTDVVLTKRGELLTKEMKINHRGYFDLSLPEKNIFDIVHDSPYSHLVYSQAHQDPKEALDSKKYVGFGATRSPQGIGSKYLVYGVDSFTLLNPRFIGIVLVVDSPWQPDWVKKLSHWKYQQQGWKDLPWIADLSPNVFTKLPVGLSGNPLNLQEGRPGTILVKEEIFRMFT